MFKLILNCFFSFLLSYFWKIPKFARNYLTQVVYYGLFYTHKLGEIIVLGGKESPLL